MSPSIQYLSTYHFNNLFALCFHLKNLVPSPLDILTANIHSSDKTNQVKQLRKEMRFN